MRSHLAGGTSYEGQSPDELLRDFREMQSDSAALLDRVRIAKADPLWTGVNLELKGFTAEAETMAAQLQGMEVLARDVLDELGNQASDLNRAIGIAKHQRWGWLTEDEMDLYREVRDFFTDKMDLSNMAAALTGPLPLR